MMADEHPRSQGDDVDCVEVVEIITDYLEGALPERERRRLENHLAACPGCAEYVAQMRAMAGSLGGLREDAIPADLREAVLAAFRPAKALIRKRARAARASLALRPPAGSGAGSGPSHSTQLEGST